MRIADDESSSQAEWDSLLDEVGYSDREDTLRLIDFVKESGADHDELVEAVRTGNLGPLALDLALRPRGELVSFNEAAERVGLEVDEAARLWRALGFPDPRDPPLRVGPGQLETLRVLATLTGLGSEPMLRLAQVLGSSMAQLAEAFVNAFRVNVEMPRRDSGEPASEVVRGYAQMAEALVPPLTAALGDVLVGHLVAVSRASWALDEERAAVTRELVVGFADLVDYTQSTRLLSPAELAGEIGRFETKAGEIISRHHGRLVKLIGDEVMFAVEDRAGAAQVALELIEELGGVRVGLAAGPVMAHQGDYYGEVVNLAARLVKAAEPDTALVSEAVVDQASPDVAAEPVELPPLKGFDGEVRAYRLARY